MLMSEQTIRSCMVERPNEVDQKTKWKCKKTTSYFK